MDVTRLEKRGARHTYVTRDAATGEVVSLSALPPEGTTVHKPCDVCGYYQALGTGACCECAAPMPTPADILGALLDAMSNPVGR